MNRIRTTLLGLVAVAALLPSMAFALDSEGGEGGHDPVEGSTPAPHDQSGAGVVFDDETDDGAVGLTDGEPFQGQPKLKVKLPGLCKVLHSCK